VPLGRGISVGCGTGALERNLVDGGVCLEVVGVDVAPAAVQVAAREAGGRPLSYVVLDIETEPLPPGPYDIAFFNSVLHHVNRLDFCIQQVHSSLEEGALLVLCEFVGPSRFQWLPEQLRLAADMYGFLPPAYRLNYQMPGTVGALRRANVCEMIEGDPSEAVRSSEMMEVVSRYFERLDGKEMGGTLLNPLLGGIAANFDDNRELDSSFIRLAALLEDALVEYGELDSDFVVEVFRKRPVPLDGAPERETDRDRSATIERQEKEIDRALGEIRRLASLAADAEALSGTLAYQTAAVAADIAARQQANAQLKSGLFFDTARSARRLRRSKRAPGPQRDPAGATVPERPVLPVAEAGGLPARVPATFPKSALAAAAESFAADARSCNRSLWLDWLARVMGQKVHSALLLGLEASHAELARGAGVCTVADVAELRIRDHAPGLGLGWSVLDSPEPGSSYELVIWAPAASAGEPQESMREVAAMVAPEGGLAVIGLDPSVGEPGLSRSIEECLPRDWSPGREEPRGGAPVPPGIGILPDEVPAGFRILAEAAFPLWHGSTAQWSLPPDARDGMAPAVASLALYVECCLARRGLLGPCLRVRLYRRAPQALRSGPPAARAVPVDIVTMQELEVERLQRLIEQNRLGLAASEDTLAASRANLDSASRTLAYLEEEHALLSAPGTLRYARWLVYRLRRGGVSGQ
jgi:SAM-dependent methyltransferase